jgi:hypothetical protein
MKVSANINRRDLFLVGLFCLPRSRTNWYFMAVLGIAIFAFLLLEGDSTSARTILVAAFASIGGAVGALLGGFLGNTAQTLLTPEKNSGVLGDHDFWLSPTELHESTAVNHSQYKWSGIHAVVKLRSYLLVRINNYSVYVIPRRSFGSNAEFEAFFEQATAWWQSGRPAVQFQRTASGGSAGKP